MLQLFCLLAPLLSIAQTTIEPEWLTIEDGLSQGYVSSILQDSEGFLWMGTQNGLNRYDGEHFKVFTHDPSDPYSIAGDFVFDLEEFGDFILVGTQRSGLNLFHKQSHRFYLLPLGGPKPENTASLDINRIQKDRLEQFWISAASPSRLYRLRFPANFQSRFPQDLSLLDSVDIQIMFSPEEGYSTNFVLQKDQVLASNQETGQLWKVDIEGGEATLFEEQPLLNHPESSTLQTLSNDDLIAYSGEWGKNTNELNLFKNGRWNKIITDFKFERIFYIEETKQIWLGNDVEALVYDEKSLDNKSLKYQEASLIYLMRGGSGHGFEVDRSGNIWRGSTGYGVMKFSSRRTKIKTYFETLSIYATPYVSKEGDVLINPTTDGHLFIHGDQPDLYQRLFPDWKINSTGSSDHKAGTPDIFNSPFPLSQIVEDKNGDLWNIDIEQIVQIKKDGSRSIKQTIALRLQPVIYDPDLHSIFYFTGEGEFFQYDINADIVKAYHFRKLIKPGLQGFCITKTTNGHFWLGTNQGLIHAIPKEGQYDFELLSKNEPKGSGLLNNQVASVLEDPNDENILWIGTKGGGLHRLDTRDKSFRYINSKNGLPNDVIYGVLNDEHGNLWMSSNKGIIRYHPSTGEIKNFTATDGLQSDEFNTYAYAKAPDGRMIFGGINGLNIFHPDDLQDNPITPNIYLTGLSVNNQAITVGDSTGLLREAITYITEITLPFSQNNISLEFAALEYTAPSKNRFRYYLEGAEKEWTHESSENIAPYLNLSPGNYTFKIKGANGDGLWSDEITSLKINIRPPWYRTTLAYIIYIALIGLGIWRFLKFREARLRLRYNMELERQKSERLQELDNMKSRFFTNISHEFRTPLTIISGMADQIEDQPEQFAKRGASMIKRNTVGLLRLVNQILDLRKMESGALKMDMIQGDIIPYLQYMLESFHSHAENRNIQLHFSAAQPSLIMDYDPDKIQKIVSNLLSNAIRYSGEGSDVYLEVGSRQSAIGSQQTTKSLSQKEKPSSRELPTAPDSYRDLLLTVSDTGIGIPSDKLPHIFDRFYQVDDSSTRKGEGTGIGLTFTQELVKALGGNISVESEPGKGSTFKVLLPVSREAPMEQAGEGFSTIAAEEFVPLLKTDGPVDVRQQIDNGELPNLLIIEDNPDIVRYLISCLENHYRIAVAVDGQEGIEKAIEQVPDIIISDVMMPRKDGFEVCAVLKEDVRTSHIPIVLLTAKADVESRIQGLERGADVYLAKPFNKEELFVRLRKLVELRQRLQQRYGGMEIQAPAEDLDLQKEDEFIIQLRNTIHEHLEEEDYGINELCRDMAMSRSQLHRKIKALTGKSTSLFIRLTRLIRAKELLQESDLSISEIAYEVGFKTPKYFSQVFTEEYGLSPKGFVQNSKKA